MFYQNKMADFKCLAYILLLYLCKVESSNLCDEAYCLKFVHDTGCPAPAIHCDINNATHSGITMPSPTFCNCCQFCLPTFAEDEHCSLGGPGVGTTVGRCGDSLSCVNVTDINETKCVKMLSPCISLQDSFDFRDAAGNLGSLEERPVCDGKGKHSPVECVSAQTCFCVSEDGDRIFGEALNLGLSTQRQMQCGCSRLHEKIKKYISPGVRYPVEGPRCTIDGNFNPIQCLNRTCYCVDKSTGVIINEIESINLDEHPITELDCYDPELDAFPRLNEGEAPYNYTTPCLQQLELVVDFMMESVELGYNIDFNSELTECLPDGTFGRFSHTNTGSKICVDHRGQRIEDYEAEFGTAAYRNMNCNCAMTSFLMGSSKEKPVCCKNGNFRDIQCRRGMCRCVDQHGRQTTLETPDINSPLLWNCISPDWRTC